MLTFNLHEIAEIRGDLLVKAFSEIMRLAKEGTDEIKMRAASFFKAARRLDQSSIQDVARIFSGMLSGNNTSLRISALDFFVGAAHDGEHLHLFLSGGLSLNFISDFSHWHDMIYDYNTMSTLLNYFSQRNADIRSLTSGEFALYREVEGFRYC